MPPPDDLDFLTGKPNGSSSSQDALATEVWRKLIDAYRRYRENKPTKWYF